MIIKNASENSNNKMKNMKKKLLILNKLTKNDFDDKIKKKTNLLFKDPSSYLKTSNELNFDFIIGKKIKIKNDIFNLRSSNKSYTNNFVKMFAKRLTKNRAFSSCSFDVRKVFELDKKSNLNIKEERKKKLKEISIIFNNYREIINKNKCNTEENKIEFSEKTPDFLTKIIKKNLKQQENALKHQRDYNLLFKRIEESLSKTMSKDNKIHKKNSELQFYQSANLFKNSINNYRNKIEVIKLNDKNKRKSSTLKNNLRYWEMSLRSPKNNKDLRNSYLNINSERRPACFMVTEKYPKEEEKIINPNINDLNEKSLFRRKYMKTSSNSFYPVNKRNINLKKFNDLQIKGKKLIDFEEEQVNKYNGNIKILNFKYDRDSTKNLLFKMNFSINKYSFEEKLS